MAFFGITNLGPQNNFETNLVSALGLKYFSESEYLATFKKFDKDGSGAITVDEVKDMLTETYGFEPLEEEVDFFMEAFDFNRDGKVTWEEFTNALGAIKEKLDSKAKEGQTYTSYNKFTGDRFKHTRIAKAPAEHQKFPPTAGQSTGFLIETKAGKQDFLTTKDKFPRLNCDETKYAEEIIKTGLQFA